MKYNLLTLIKMKISNIFTKPEQRRYKDTPHFILSKWFKPFADRIEEVNTAKLIPCSKEIGNRYDIPKMEFEGDGITIPDPDSGAFMLEPACTFKQTQARAKQIVLRIAFSYETAARLSSDREKFNQVAELVVEHAVKKMQKLIGEGPHYGYKYLTCKLPGRSDTEEYFLELANSAGYELRFYSDLADLTKEKPNEPQIKKSTVLSKTNRR